MEAKFIYHITTVAEWNAAQASGFYAAASLAGEGFIHCSTEAQVKGVLERYFKGQTGLLKLEIEVAQLIHPPVYEKAVSVNEAFPHIYGPVNISAVTMVTAL